MIDWLVIIICLVAVTQAFKYGMPAAMPSLIFASITWAYGYFMADIDDDRAFFIGGYLAMIIAGLLFFCKGHKLTMPLIFICGLDLCFNYIGWRLYENYFEPDFHEWLFIALYLGVIAIMLNWEGEEQHGRARKNRAWLDNVYTDVMERNKAIYQRKAGAGH